MCKGGPSVTVSEEGVTVDGGGGGGGSLLDQVINAGTQVVSGGLVGYQGGQVTSGVTTNVVKDTLKEVTGAKAAEEANALAREQFETQRNAALNAREEARARTARDQLAASRLAASNRRRGSVNNANKGQAGDNQFQSQSVSLLGSDEQDFLGL